MDPLHPPDVMDAIDADQDLDRIRRRLDHVMAGDDPVDVRAYLLDPPPTAEQLERVERRRLLVRRGSIAATAVLAVVLLAPWPGSGAAQRDEAAVAAVPAAATDAEPTQALPVRVDVPPRARPARARPARARPRPPATSPAPAPAQDPIPSRPAPATSSPAAQPRPRPADPAPVVPPDAGVLVPVT